MLIITKEGVFAKHVAEDMLMTLSQIFELMTDSQAGRDTVANPGVTKNSVHFERWLYYMRDQYLRRNLNITFCPTDLMRADDKTKVVHKLKFLFCRMHQMNLPESD